MSEKVPEKLNGPCAWHGNDIGRDPRWQFEWTDAECGELLATTRAAARSGLCAEAITPSSFPLPTAARKLAQIAKELEEGCGMVRIRGIEPACLEQGLIKFLWMGVCSHLGQPVYQNYRGELIRRIQDEGAAVGERYGQLEDDGTGRRFLSSRARTASTGPLRFHTDRTDIVGLLCSGISRTGGTSQIASSVTVHNLMVERRPDLATLLYEPIWRSRLGEERDGENKPYALPVFGVEAGKFTSHYSRTYVEAAQLHKAVPKMTAVQWAALDLLGELAEECALITQFEVGDMQFLNSHITYHARGAFEDDVFDGFQRCLYRIWVCATQNHRSLPTGQEVLWGAIQAGQMRGGVVQA